MRQRRVITLDGLAGSGKTTLARLLAERLRFLHVNTGLLYRGVGWLVLQNHLDPQDEASIASLLSRSVLSLDLSKEGVPEIFHNGIPVQENLQVPEISEAASIVASSPAVRNYLHAAQREAFPGKNIVAEGRDMGTVVFPDADLKFFITTSLEARMSRRITQLNQLQIPFSDSDLRREILERDERDQNRVIAPTIPASDAHIIDNSGLALTDVVEHMYTFAAQLGLADT